MQTLILQIPDSQYSFILSEIEKFKDVKIKFSTDNDSNNLKDQIRQAVNEVNLVKKGIGIARPARELISEL